MQVFTPKCLLIKWSFSGKHSFIPEFKSCKVHCTYIFPHYSIIWLEVYHINIDVFSTLQCRLGCNKHCPCCDEDDDLVDDDAVTVTVTNNNDNTPISGNANMGFEKDGVNNIPNGTSSPPPYSAANYHNSYL